MLISESKLLPTLSVAKKIHIDDVKNLVFLYLITLHILRQYENTAIQASNYARRTGTSRKTLYLSLAHTDLYELLSLLSDKAQIPITYINQFIDNLKNQHYDLVKANRLLLAIEYDLNILITNYKSIRRIATSWDKSYVSHEARSLAITRLIQALEKRAQTGDILPQLKKLANYENLLLKNVCNPETGKNCEEAKPRLGLLKQLAIATGIGVGAFMLGRALAKGMNE